MELLFIVLGLVFVSHLSSVASNESNYKSFNPTDDNKSERVSEDPPGTFQQLRAIDEEYSKCGKYNLDIRELSIMEARNLFATRRLLITELTLCYLQRIEQMNPGLHAVTQVNPDAVREAIKADFEIMLKLKQGVLHGIPVLIKDNMGTDDGMENTAGSPALLGLKPKSDAQVVKKLRKAGAIILGKSNLSEFAYFRGTNEPSGWSGVGGQTWGPYNSSVNPSGSSSGSAVAVASNLALLALGSETDGSISSPASKQSLFGLKPTIDVVSVQGVIPLSFSQDVVGPMTRSAKDAEIAFRAIREEKFNLLESGYCSPNDISCDPKKKVRIGVLRENFWDYGLPELEAQKPILEGVLKTLESAESISVIDPVQPVSDFLNNAGHKQELTVFLHEFKHSLNKYLVNDVRRENLSSNAVSSLKDIIAYNIEHKLLDKYNQELLERAEGTDGLQNTTYVSFRENNKKGVRAYLDYLIDHYGLDAIVAPGDPDLRLGRICSLAAIAGYPSLTVPAGVRSDGAPIGVIFVGKPYTEHVLLSIGTLLDDRRSLPKFLQ